MGNTPSIDDQIFDLKFGAKKMARESARHEKEQKKQTDICKKHMKNGNMDVARVYAENAIREKNTSINMLKMSSRLDAVAGRLNAMNVQQKVSKQMEGVVATMGQTMKSMNLEQTSLTMDKFESVFENLDVNLKVMESSLGTVSQAVTPESEVADMMMQVAEENELDMGDKFNEIGIGKEALAKKRQQQEEVKSEKTLEQQLEERLAGI